MTGTQLCVPLPTHDLPAYLALLESGELEQRTAQAQAHLACCDLCAWECKVDRLYPFFLTCLFLHIPIPLQSPSPGLF
jgi:hypothetical protein